MVRHNFIIGNKMKWLRRICLSLALFWGMTVAAQVVVEMKMDTANVLVGQQVQLTTSVYCNTGARVEFPSFGKERMLVKGVEVIDQSAVDTVLFNDKNRLKISRKYRITSFDSALYTIPPMEVLVDGKAYTAKAPVGFKVDMLEVDTTNVTNFAGPHAVLPQTFLWKSTYTLLSIVAWVILTAAVVVAVLLTRRKPLTTKKIIIPPMPPFKKASAALKGLTSDWKDKKCDDKDFYIRLTDALRDYLHGRYGIMAKEKTTREIVASIENILNDGQVRNLHDLFETADLVKFAKVSVSDVDKKKSFSVAEDFFKTTYDEAQENVKPEVRTVVLNDGMQKAYRRTLRILFAVLLVGGLAYVSMLTLRILSAFF